MPQLTQCKGVATAILTEGGETKVNAAHLGKLEKRLAKLGKPEMRPFHPLIDRDFHPVIAEWDRSNFRAWAAWKQEQPRRKLAMRLAYAQLAKGDTGAAIYKLARESGFTVRTYSQRTANEKAWCESAHDYLKSFWRFCGLSQKPCAISPDKGWGVGVGPVHYERWLAHVRAYNELLSEIEAVRGMDKP